MGFFSGDSGSVEVIPQTGWQRKGIGYLKGLLGTTPDLPTRQVAGMSEAEQQGQGILMKVLSGQSFQDPRTSPLYEGLRAESISNENRNADILRRRAQLGGGFNSSASFGAEAQLRNQASNQRLTLLGGLYNQERNRDNSYTRMAAASQYGALPRMLEQMQQEAVFQQEMQQQMFPYTQGSSIAQALMSHQPTMYMTEPEQSGFGGMLPFLGTAGGAIAGGILGAPFGPAGIAIGAGMGAGIGGQVGGAAGNAWG